MTIKNWPLDQRPREKLLQHGPKTLGDAELLALLLQTGVAGKSALELGHELLRCFGGIRGLLAAPPNTLIGHRGLGPAKYAKLQAALELSRRHLREHLSRGDILTSPEHTRRFLAAQLRDRDKEVFACLFLDTRHRVIRFVELFHGTLDGATVHPREVVRHALSLNAAAVIVAHNHPSGVTDPSAADRAITQRLKDALALVEIRLLDHFIVGDGDPLSFAERGWL
jgi:DNA repair protein RadC